MPPIRESPSAGRSPEDDRGLPDRSSGFARRDDVRPRGVDWSANGSPKETDRKDVIALVCEGQQQIRGHGLILEEMRAQNRATIEAVEATRVALEEKIDSVARDTGGRLTLLEAAVRQNSADIRKDSDDIRIPTKRVDRLGPLTQRVTSLEQRTFRKA